MAKVKIVTEVNGIRTITLIKICKRAREGWMISFQMHRGFDHIGTVFLPDGRAQITFNKREVVG